MQLIHNITHYHSDRIEHRLNVDRSTCAVEVMLLFYIKAWTHFEGLQASAMIY